MSSKTVFVFCAQALLIQNILTQSINYDAIDSLRLSLPGHDHERNPREIITSGYPKSILDFNNGLPISSSIPHTGLSIVSDNVFEGTVTVIGELPFLSAVTLEGSLPSSGAGTINYGCGNGVTGMLSENPGLIFGPASGLGIGCGRII